MLLKVDKKFYEEAIAAGATDDCFVVHYYFKVEFRKPEVKLLEGPKQQKDLKPPEDPDEFRPQHRKNRGGIKKERYSKHRRPESILAFTQDYKQKLVGRNARACRKVLEMSVMATEGLMASADAAELLEKTLDITHAHASAAISNLIKSGIIEVYQY